MIGLIPFILLTLAWIGGVGLDTGSTLRFVTKWGWRWESNSIPRKFMKYFQQTGRWRYEVIYTTLYILLLPLFMIFWTPSTSFPITMIALVYYVGVHNLFIHE